jgi:hypothetical protein
MKGKFDITGRTPGHAHSATVDDVMERFVEGTEPMTTMTFQLPERLKHALKRVALDRKTSVKALLIEIIEGHLTVSKQ